MRQVNQKGLIVVSTRIQSKWEKVPAPSYLATRLADDLVKVGEILGFQAGKEEPIRENSEFRVDVIWRAIIPQGSRVSEINVASIEIQYSKSLSSISHSIFKAEKTLHPACHFVISFFKLSDDYIENVLKAHFPDRGLVVYNGEEEVRELNLWITNLMGNKHIRDKWAMNGKRMRDFVFSQPQSIDKSEIEKKIREMFRPEIEEVFAGPRIIDKHATILWEDLATCIDRFVALKRMWKERAKLGLLPDLYHAGFPIIEKMLENHKRKHLFFFEPLRRKYRSGRTLVRNFEDIIELTDELKNIRSMLRTVERGYWQRLEGYSPSVADKKTELEVTPEFETNQQVFNAADTLCMSYWKGIFSNSNACPWMGLPVFGEIDEFWHSAIFIYAPDYVKRRFTGTWLFFSHEIAHKAIDKLMMDKEFLEIFRDLNDIFSSFPSLTTHSTNDHLAVETIADVIATLISGEQYVSILTDLKYYPSFTIFSRQNLAGRAIQYPFLLRVLVCSLVIRLTWGFEGTAEDQILHRAINSTREEDLFAENIIQLLLEKTDVYLNAISSHSPEMIRKYLNQSMKHLKELEYIAIPNVIALILKKKAIQRIKCFVKSDFYHTNSGDYYYDADLNRMSGKNLFNLESKFFAKTSAADRINKLRKKKTKSLEIISDDIRNCRLAVGEPREIIASLNNLAFRTGKIDEKWNWTALSSIVCGKTA